MKDIRIQWNTVLMAGSLAAALFYNGRQIDYATRAIQAQKRATELRLFTQLHTLVNESATKFPFYEAELEEAIRTKQGRLSQRSTYLFNNTLNNFEYLAWLFNHNFVTIPEAREAWLPGMRVFYEYAVRLRGPTTTILDYPELTRLLGKRGRSDAAAPSGNKGSAGRK